MIWSIPEADFNAINAAITEEGSHRIGWIRNGLYLVDDSKTQLFDADAAVDAATVHSTLADYLEAAGTQWCYEISHYTNSGEHYYKRPPMDLNFKTQLNRRLFPKITMSKGEVQAIDYYAEGTLQQDGSVVYTKPVINESFFYLRTDAGLAVMRNQFIRWYRADGSLDMDPAHMKTRVKYYNNIEMLEESERRRKNVVDNAGIAIIFLMDQTMPQDAGTKNIDKARKLWRQYEREIHLYITVGVRELEEAIAEDELFGWLDNPIGGGATIRSYAVNELDIWD